MRWYRNINISNLFILTNSLPKHTSMSNNSNSMFPNNRKLFSNNWLRYHKWCNIYRIIHISALIIKNRSYSKCNKFLIWCTKLLYSYQANNSNSSIISSNNLYSSLYNSNHHNCSNCKLSNKIIDFRISLPTVVLINNNNKRQIIHLIMVFKRLQIPLIYTNKVVIILLILFHTSNNINSNLIIPLICLDE